MQSEMKPWVDDITADYVTLTIIKSCRNMNEWLIIGNIVIAFRDKMQHNRSNKKLRNVLYNRLYNRFGLEVLPLQKFRVAM